MEAFHYDIKPCSPTRVASFSSPTTDWTSRCIQQALQDTLPPDASDVSVTREPIFSVMKTGSSSSRHAGPSSSQQNHQVLSFPGGSGDSPSSASHSTPLSAVTTENGAATLSPAAAQFLRSIPDLWYMLVPPVGESARE